MFISVASQHYCEEKAGEDAQVSHLLLDQMSVKLCTVLG
jgi:hypothetical protein